MIAQSKRNYYTNLVKMLEIEPARRNDKHIAAILDYISRIKYFKTMTNSSTIRTIASHMTVLFVNRGDYIFRFGDRSEALYYIIEGKVEVNVPFNERGEPFGLFCSNKESITQWKTAEVIKEEGTFGEWGILSNKPRAASVLALKNTILAVCDKKTYTIVIKTNEQLKIMKLVAKVERVLPIKLEINKIIQLSYYMTRLELTLNDKLYNEKEPLKYLYLILDGDIKVF